MIAMAKTRWSRHLAEVIHNMNFRPKESWTNIHLLSKGERSHHSAPSTIQMRMPSGELVTTDEGNVRVFSAHFGKLLIDLKDTDDSVIDDIILREVSTELDSTPEWAEFIIEVVELTNDKSPGLNNPPPPPRSRRCQQRPCFTFSTSLSNFGRTGSTLSSGTSYLKAGVR